MSEIKFDCPHCGGRLKVDDSCCGQTVACPKCKGDIIIPDSPKPKAKLATIVSEPVEQVSEGSNSEAVLTLRPVFVPWVTVLSVLPLTLFFTVWGAGFCGGFSMFAVKALKLSLPTWFTFVFFGCLFFFGIPFVVYNAKKRTYAKTEYRFYRNRLEYAEGFWTVENKTIKYDKITETSMRRGVIQKRYGLGTIFLATPATGFQQGRAMSGIRVANIKNPEEVYETVQKLINS